MHPKKILSIIALLFLLMQIGYCQEEKQLLQLIVKSNKEEYKQGEQIKLSVGIKNNSAKDISICIYDIEHKLMENLEYKREEYPPQAPPRPGEKRILAPNAIRIYKLRDWTKRKLSIVSGEDFIFLKPQESYSIELTVDTIIVQDSSWRYIFERESEWKWGEGLNEFPSGVYQITVRYENSIIGIGDDGDAIHAHDPQSAVSIKMHDAWFGIIASDSIDIEVAENKTSVNERKDKSPLEAASQFDQRIDILIKKYKDANPEEDARVAFNNNDKRFMGIACGIAPGVDGVVFDDSTVYHIPETGDVILSKKHDQFQMVANNYAERYNKEMLRLMQKTPFEFAIKSDKEVYEPGETIKIEVAMKNITNKEIIIWHAGFWTNHKIMLVDDNKEDVPLTDFGKSCEQVFNQKVRDKNVKWPLAPGQEDKYELELNKSYLLNSAGTYHLTVAYEENFPDGWVGTIVSNTIAIKIREKISDPLPLNERSDGLEY